MKPLRLQGHRLKCILIVVLGFDSFLYGWADQIVGHHAASMIITNVKTRILDFGMFVHHDSVSHAPIGIFTIHVVGSTQQLVSKYAVHISIIRDFEDHRVPLAPAINILLRRTCRVRALFMQGLKEFSCG